MLNVRDDNALIGTLANGPIFVSGMHFGQEVSVLLTEIEDVSLTAD